MVALPPELGPLDLLRRARSGPAEYYARLLDSDNELLKVGAWAALLDREDITPAQYPKVLELARYGAIQARAFRFFEGNWEHGLAAQVAEIAATTEAEADILARRAELACDEAAGREAERVRFLATGRFETFVAMIGRADQTGGWRTALPLAVDLLVLTPHQPIAADGLLRVLADARQAELLTALLNFFRECALHPYLITLYDAVSRLLAGDAAGCRKQLQVVDAARPPRPDMLVRVRPYALKLNAEALEKLGDYRGAYDGYAALNRLEDGSKPVNPDDYARLVRDASAQAIPPLPPDPLTNHFVMCGFPRSGTTLLENALAAHPQIETFEEIASFSSMQFYLGQHLAAAKTTEEVVEICQVARGRYYDEALRRSRKPGANIFIDKMPMRSAEAGLMLKMFPEKRYVFSIRHPFDVVLSCFKQQFVRNMAMEHFRTFDNAAKLYDFTMSQWFAHHTMDDPRVHYLRYDDLVTDFEPSMQAALHFLGLGWDDQVRDFANAADNRFARTPSYQKVRQGLKLGIQSSWRNYAFLFTQPSTKPLAKWAEFFGYPTK